MTDVPDSPLQIDLPEHWREQAEEVRAHLCLLRGGAPFLSPADAWQLIRWLEAGVPMLEVLAALERAALARRAQRAKTPLSLVAAKRHLGKPMATPFHATAVHGEPPLAPLARTLLASPAEPGEVALRAGLHEALLAVRAASEEARGAACAAIRDFFEGLWALAGEPGRGRYRAAAKDELADLLSLVDESTHPALIEEAARDLVRQRYPALTVASVLALLAEGSDGDSRASGG
jgi:hypothetical protein